MGKFGQIWAKEGRFGWVRLIGGGMGMVDMGSGWVWLWVQV